MKRKWFELLSEDGNGNGNALTLATAVSVEVEDVDMLRDAVFAKVSRALPTNVITADLTVFANRAAFAAKQKLEEDSPIDLFEKSARRALASFPLGIDEYQEGFKNKLGFTKALGMTVSTFKRHLIYSCPTFAGDSGAAVIVKDGFLAGIHLETINGEQIERKKIIKDHLTDVEQSLDNIVTGGLAQGCCALLVNEFKNVVTD
ncbi:Crinkler (CRN) [Phytophthora megakarya]|uniref:Crinkler (CRN) n=1 Tax=Phytophthora megakarya TaxID=4795 RepID=A0A225VVH9_9STRA|nr:Crinkler (CRN) [Phytophthora megakarya]